MAILRRATALYFGDGDDQGSSSGRRSGFRMDARGSQSMKVTLPVFKSYIPPVRTMRPSEASAAITLL